ncbi:hypothetical protein [Verrucosispora sp. WMMC514]|uniref:hypothetical protein n=1 Tax=Verrucosispora sp. WMMC514 TaxID=3015156 RepID=UPI00248C3C74|nr:hypothetical protein [Verrucosispora sp. WMMC514]WBB94225.1 hypothetical protein O7597_15350 [Verrucosispora sp. WMMC514]
MGIQLLVALACDKCGTRCPLPPEAQWDARTARTAAERLGWQVVGGRRGPSTDRCPADRTVPPPGPAPDAHFNPPLPVPAAVKE